MRFTNTNWNLYRSFILAYETKNMHRVAEILNISPQAVRQNIKELTNQVGTKLFNASRSGVQPTSAAIELYKEIEPAVSQLCFGERNISEFNADSAATIRMITSATMTGIMMCDYFKIFKQKYPKVEIEIFNRADSESFNLLLQSKVDFIIDYDHICKKYDLKKIDLFVSNCILIASKNFIRENNLGKTITKFELSKTPIIGYDKNISQLISENNISALSFLKTATVEPVYTLVKSGIGIGIYFDDLLKRQTNGEIDVILPADFELPKVTMSIGYKGKLTKAAQVFVDGLIKYIANLKHN